MQKPTIAGLVLLGALLCAPVQRPAAAQPLPGEAAREREIARLKEQTAASPKDVGAWHDLAARLREAGRWAEAVDAESRAVEVHPRYAVAFYGRGVARMELRSYAAARQDFTSAISLWESRGGVERFRTVERPRDEHVEAYRNRGVSFAHEGNLAAAATDLATALSLRPDDPRLLFERGHLLEKAGRGAEAAADFQRAGLIHAEARSAAGARACIARLEQLGARDAAADVERKLTPPVRGTDLP